MPQIVIKNTFLDVDDFYGTGLSASCKRSASVPRTWKPDWTNPATSPGTASTAASESDINPADLSDGDIFEARAGGSPNGGRKLWTPYWEEPPSSPSGNTDGGSSTPGHLVRSITAPAKVQSSSAAEGDMTCIPCGLEVSPHRLNPEARAFKPTILWPGEVGMLVASAKQAMLGSSCVTDVQVNEAPVGAVTTIVAKVKDSARTSPSQWTAGPVRLTIGLAKKSLLAASRMSKDTYVLGYAESPFTDVSETEFTARLVALPPSIASMACWDTFQKGFCPRHGKCSWQHPQEHDVVTLRVVLKVCDA
jgi:hypothetical protein